MPIDDIMRNLFGPKIHEKAVSAVALPEAAPPDATEPDPAELHREPRSRITLRRATQNDGSAQFGPITDWVAVTDENGARIGLVRPSWSVGAIVLDFGGRALFDTLSPEQVLQLSGEAVDTTSLTVEAISSEKLQPAVETPEVNEISETPPLPSVAEEEHSPPELI